MVRLRDLQLDRWCSQRTWRNALGFDEPSVSVIRCRHHMATAHLLCWPDYSAVIAPTYEAANAYVSFASAACEIRLHGDAAERRAIRV